MAASLPRFVRYRSGCRLRGFLLLDRCMGPGLRRLINCPVERMPVREGHGRGHDDRERLLAAATAPGRLRRRPPMPAALRATTGIAPASTLASRQSCRSIGAGVRPCFDTTNSESVVPKAREGKHKNVNGRSGSVVSSPQRNVNEIRSVRNTNHAPLPIFISLIYLDIFIRSAASDECACSFHQSCRV